MTARVVYYNGRLFPLDVSRIGLSPPSKTFRPNTAVSTITYRLAIGDRQVVIPLVLNLDKLRTSWGFTRFMNEMRSNPDVMINYKPDSEPHSVLDSIDQRIVELINTQKHMFYGETALVDFDGNKSSTNIPYNSLVRQGVGFDPTTKLRIRFANRVPLVLVRENVFGEVNEKEVEQICAGTVFDAKVHVKDIYMINGNMYARAYLSEANILQREGGVDEKHEAKLE